ncbi:MAG: cyclopropane-fatty-acyl-phospholipid synthase family protein [Alphaproteobacteria bacterium]|jgi:cyclopropane-fatty-acyl-phospholipid synthase|nr:cyclopropane-fatty-acyl-phospholipid synthase family protein [Alphaproteobacteria bacterium]MBU2040932.1 cyclopropane-fatty-acyl-phospholipid synthase family protein [Alphaproteobacteria bacterium]MBU2125428.1 cyclopropane-fatty-acyl-phospholipid synthase family protein [Alphaproteobacteria bacterium]MBU2208333.1 cyclopropane-fatty-acyl-phospholipid synthase family protein [Alphaproteobacteria bacterium]MBU2292316.1 cyclopropane-fatty-acyl-phospholipid synthase family protein [Alphaproteobac
MSFANVAIRRLQDAPFPDFVARPAIDSLVSEARKRLDREGPHDEAGFARDMARRAIAEHTAAANAQHYELPPEFFEICLGERLKYSCCLYPAADTTLDQAEEAALAETCAHAALMDGQRVLELGCGWGSLSLWMAERYPRSSITAVSNSHGQRRHIEAQATARGLTNLTVITCDMNDFTPDAGGEGFDRIVSVEMFEHMANWRALLTRAHGWLKPDGRMFIHIFTHRDAPYRFDHTDSGDFIAQHFFTGGVMPSRGLMRQFPDLFRVEQEWTWSGVHYQRTADHWLANMDANADRVMELMRETYGADAALWRRRWRRFYLATAGLFGNDGGNTWAVSHYLLKPARGAET